MKKAPLKKILKSSISLFLGMAILEANFIIAADRTVDDFRANQAYNNVTSDAFFTDVNSMDVNAIQAFLVQNTSFLKDYSEGGRSAAQIIYDAAQANTAGASSGEWCGVPAINHQNGGTINPKAILIMLQKEQSLITESTLDPDGLNAAMGYSCPDSGGCNSAYAGFTNQVEWGSWQLRYNYEYAKKYNTGNKPTQNINSPGKSCTSHYVLNEGESFTDNSIYTDYQDYTTNVTMLDNATASLYSYTPHVYNSAYNFWKIMYRWFDPTQITGGNPPATPPPSSQRKAGDANSDNAIDSTDLSILADAWGRNITANTGADYNGDGIVDSTDLSILADAWGK